MKNSKSLRPNNFNEFIGQKRLVHTIKTIIKSASKRRVMCDHLLFHGKPGIGKTSLSMLVAKNMNRPIKFAQGSLLEKKADVLSLFATIQKNEVIFIDEIHSINKHVEELIYSAMEDQVVDIPIGADGESKIVRMKLPPFTLIGATTKINKITQPLKERFGLIGRLVDYEVNEICEILKLTAKKLDIKIDEIALKKIAKYSKSTPRIANNLLNRCRDFSIDSKLDKIGIKIVDKTFRFLGLYKYGLDDTHIKYIKALGEIFNEKWASIDAISGIICEEKENIENDIEPILLKEKLLIKSSRGRKLTSKGVEYLTTYNLI